MKIRFKISIELYNSTLFFNFPPFKSVILNYHALKEPDMETFNDIITGDKPVLVDFYATWCGPCKAMSPVIDSLAEELHGTARILKIDIDKNRTAAEHFHVQAVPTLMIFKRGEVVWRNSGAMDKMSLLTQLRAYID
jgi:thioredoxin